MNKGLNCRLRNIRIKNFKSISEKELSFKHLNEIFGENKTGKTSVLEAIQFCFEGTSKDIDKIKKGEEESIVEMQFVDPADKEGKLVLKNKMNTKGVVTPSITFRGIAITKPRTFIKDYVSFGTFNPRSILNKKERGKVLLSLIPIFIKKEDIDEFDIKDKESVEKLIDEGSHAFIVLNHVEKDLRNTRESLGREKDIYEKSLEKRKREVMQHTDNITDKYGGDLKCDETLDDLIKEKSELKYEFDLSIAEKEKAGIDIEKCDINIKQKKNEILSINKQIEAYQHSIDLKKQELSNVEKDLVKDEQERKKCKDNFLKLQSNTNTEVMEKISEIDKNIQKKKDLNLLETDKNSLKDYEIEKDKAYKEWKKYDDMIKINFKKFRNRILSPIEKKVIGLKIEEDGKMTYEGKSIDTLSDSESIILSLKLKFLDKVGTVVCLDKGEALSPKTLLEIDWPKNKSIVMSRVSNQPIESEEWIHHKMP